MYEKTLDRLHERINTLNLMNQIEDQQLKLEIAYATIEHKMSRDSDISSYETHEALEDIELRMSILEEKYSNLHTTLLHLGKYVKDI